MAEDQKQADAGASSTSGQGDGNKGSKSATSGDGGASEVDKKLHAAEEKGYLGNEVDPTPNENYTFGGNDKPTPETDAKLRAKARGASGLG